MNDDQYQPQPDRPYEPPPPQDAHSSTHGTRGGKQWDSTVNTRALGTVVVVVAVIAVIGLGLTLLTRNGAQTTEASNNAGLGAGYGILERRVNQAFDNRNEQPAAVEEDMPFERATQSELEAAVAAEPAGGDTAIEAERRQTQDINRQRLMMEEQERMRDAQREAVPSVLPENPPRPVPLGGKNY